MFLSLFLAMGLDTEKNLNIQTVIERNNYEIGTVISEGNLSSDNTHLSVFLGKKNIC